MKGKAGVSSRSVVAPGAALFALALFCLFVAPAFAAMPDAEFIALCAEGAAEQVRQALAEGANPNARMDGPDDDGATALIAAAHSGSAGAVAALLAAGADKSVKDKRGYDALWWANNAARYGVEYGGPRARRLPDPELLAAEHQRVVELLQGGGQGAFTGMIESVDPSDGPWLTLSGPDGRRVFLCGALHEDCERWRCRDLGRRLTAHYVHSVENLEGGEPVGVDALVRVDGPTGPADAELNRVRCAAQALRIGGPGNPGEAENAAAANSLGVWYEKGARGLRKNLEEAKTWYELAAASGNALAMHNLGDLYREGKGVKQDGREAFRWYKKAADAGHAIGLEDMADCRLKGVGAPPDRAEALRLYREAARKGRQSAARKLRELGE